LIQGSNDNESAQAQAIRETLASAPLLESFYLLTQNRNPPIFNRTSNRIIYGALQEHPCLRQLKIDLSIKPLHHPDISNLLNHNYSLRSLTLICDNLDDLVAILNALKPNLFLESLEVEVLSQGNDMLDLEHDKMLGAILPHLKTLERLHLSGNIRPITRPTNMIRGFRLNNSLIDVRVPWLGGDAKKAVDFFCFRNKHKPRLDDAPTKDLPLALGNLIETHSEAARGLSVVYEILRGRDKWYEVCDDGSEETEKCEE